MKNLTLSRGNMAYEQVDAPINGILSQLSRRLTREARCSIFLEGFHHI